MDKVGAMVSGVDWNNLGGHGNAEVVGQIFIIIIILNKASISQTLSEHQPSICLTAKEWLCHPTNT